MTPERLQELLTQFKKCRVAIIGDFWLDKYLETDPTLVAHSSVTGRTEHQVVVVRRAPSAAGTVVSNLAALHTGELFAFGAIGNDGEGFDLIQGLERAGCHTQGLLRVDELMTPTNFIPRDLGIEGRLGEHQRYQLLSRRPQPRRVIEQLYQMLVEQLPSIDAVIIMDQADQLDTGVITPPLRHALGELALMHPRVIFWGDSKRAVRQYRNIIIKANQFEAVGRTTPLPGDSVALRDLRNVVPRLRAELNAPIYITAGEHGVFVSDPEVTFIPAVKINTPIDPTGAGDAATAGAVLTLVAGGSHSEAALVGNLVASITVQQIGTTGTASPAMVMDAHDIWTEQNRHRQNSGGRTEFENDDSEEDDLT